jgi:hypothetical protein
MLSQEKLLKVIAEDLRVEQPTHLRIRPAEIVKSWKSRL